MKRKNLLVATAVFTAAAFGLAGCSSADKADETEAPESGEATATEPADGETVEIDY